MKYISGAFAIFLFLTNPTQSQELLSVYPDSNFHSVLASSTYPDSSLVPPSFASKALPKKHSHFQEVKEKKEKEDNYRWQLAAGYEFARFRSIPFHANFDGFHTSFVHYFTHRLGIECNVVAAVGTHVLANEESKYLLYACGPHIVWRKREWEPWVRTAMGGLRTLPQTASGGLTAGQLGGGVDWYFHPDLSLRLEGDCVPSWLYSKIQINFQSGVGLVLRF